MNQSPLASFELRPYLPTRPNQYRDEKDYVKDVLDALVVPIDVGYDETWQELLDYFGRVSGLSTVLRGNDKGNVESEKRALAVVKSGFDYAHIGDVFAQTWVIATGSVTAKALDKNTTVGTDAPKLDLL